MSMLTPIETVSAQSSNLTVRGSLDAAVMLSRDQLERLGYDRMGVLGAGQLGYGAARWLDLTFGVTGGAFFASEGRTGGLVAACLGALVHGPRDAISPYAAAEVGPGITGQLVRPFLRLSLGLDIPVLPSLMLGPAIGYGQLLQTNGPLDSTDARYMSVGFSVLYRHIEEPPPPPARRVWIDVRHEEVPAPPAEAPSEDLTVLLERVLPSAKVELLAPVLFAFDSDTLEPVGVAMLHEVARELSQRSDLKLIEIQGYADRRGSAEYNRDLSRRRAERVLAWLVEHGIDPARLQVAAEGAAELVEDGSDEPSHEQNRRVVFRVLEVSDE